MVLRYRRHLDGEKSKQEQEGANMKWKRIVLFAAVAFVVLIGVRPARAQSDEVEKVNIPFEFSAGTQKMPAGTYSFARGLATDTITIRNSAGHYHRFLMGVPASDGNNKTGLVFDRLGNSYFLKEFESDLQDVSFPVEKAESSKVSRTASAQVVVSANHS
jgi:hypothetical protein